MQQTVRRCKRLLDAAVDACGLTDPATAAAALLLREGRRRLYSPPAFPSVEARLKPAERVSQKRQGRCQQLQAATTCQAERLLAPGGSAGGAPRGFASASPQPAQEPEDTLQSGEGSSSGDSSAGSAPASGAARPKPRFLLERLGLAQPQQQPQQQPGTERGTGGAGGRGPWAPASRPPLRHERGGPQRQPGVQPLAFRPQNGRQEPGDSRQRRPWQPAGQAPSQQQQQQQRGQNGSQNDSRRQPAGAAINGLQRRQDQQGAAPRPPHHQQRPHGKPGWGQPAAQQPFAFPAAMPTEFPTAFPRAASGPGTARQQRKAEQHKRKAREAAEAVAQEEVPEEVVIPEDVTVLRLAQLLDVSVPRLEEVLQELGESCNSRQDLVPPDSAELAAMEFGKVAVLARRGGRDAPLEADAQPRPAVVTVMGHVDHGKTTLLDALRSTAVAAGEAGGITQHIGAFEVQMPGSRQSLTFLDTPGHAAFSAMRARGAAVTDLVVLVVAADDGIMAQTREAISHARAAGCPIVVAITKCDAPNAQPQRVRQQLIAAGLETEEAGGSIQVVEVAAVTGQGLEELEEALLLQAELMELGASRSRRAEAVVIEAKVDKGHGPVATVVVKRGTLKVGLPMVVGTEWGRVRSLRGTGGAAVKEVLPGQPAEIAGLKGLPRAGDQLLVVDSEERAQVISRARTQNAEFHRRASVARMLAEQRRASEGGEAEGPGQGLHRTLHLVIKADVQGSAEAVRQAVAHMSTEHVRVQVVHVGVGPVSQSDVQLAVPLGAKILGFNVRTAAADVDALAKQHGIEVRCQRVIYGLLEDVGSLLVGASPKVEHEVVAGTAEVLQVFQLKGNRGKEAGVVAGCRVAEGSVKASLKYRVLRSGEVVHEGRCASLKRHKLEVETVGKGTECGVLLDGFHDVRPGDQLQCIAVEMRNDAHVNTGPENKW